MYIVNDLLRDKDLYAMAYNKDGVYAIILTHGIDYALPELNTGDFIIIPEFDSFLDCHGKSAHNFNYCDFQILDLYNDSEPVTDETILHQIWIDHCLYYATALYGSLPCEEITFTKGVNHKRFLGVMLIPFTPDKLSDIEKQFTHALYLLNLAYTGKTYEVYMYASGEEVNCYYDVKLFESDTVMKDFIYNNLFVYDYFVKKDDLFKRIEQKPCMYIK